MPCTNGVDMVIDAISIMFSGVGITWITDRVEYRKASSSVILSGNVAEAFPFGNSAAEIKMLVSIITFIVRSPHGGNL